MLVFTFYAKYAVCAMYITNKR